VFVNLIIFLGALYYVCGTKQGTEETKGLFMNIRQESGTCQMTQENKQERRYFNILKQQAVFPYIIIMQIRNKIHQIFLSITPNRKKRLIMEGMMMIIIIIIRLNIRLWHVLTKCF
jgi:hypothetical protein